MSTESENGILETYRIDPALTRKILDAWNRSDPSTRSSPIKAAGIPGIDGTTVIDRNSRSFLLPAEAVRKGISRFSLPLSIREARETPEGFYILEESFLREAGILLYPRFSFGVLNGGSATSYVDITKNRDYCPVYFDICRGEFDRFSGAFKGSPKGLVPAFPNGGRDWGPSFMELKFRALLIAGARYAGKTGGKGESPISLFQMTSSGNNEEILSAYRNYRESPFIRNLIRSSGIEFPDVHTGIQPMIAAFTHSSRGERKEIFFSAYGEKDRPLPLPGGHGQNFMILAGIYRKLYEQGKRFVSIGNVDNLGYTPDPVILGLLALSGKQAAFEFSKKTPADVKGGILVTDAAGRLNCADIGPAVSKEEVREAEAQGKPILFNCASGFFDLEYLVKNLDRISSALPIRFTDQDKDAGSYSQAEQITWEIIGMLDDILICAVDKNKRFLSAKMLLESFLTSGFHIEEYRNIAQTGDPFPALSAALSTGLGDLLRSSYRMTRRNGIWKPMEEEETIDLTGESHGR